jgi:hypothetical protein
MSQETTGQVPMENWTEGPNSEMLLAVLMLVLEMLC